MVQRWFDLGDAMSRERRTRERSSLRDRVMGLFLRAARGFLQLIRERPAVGLAR